MKKHLQYYIDANISGGIMPYSGLCSAANDGAVDEELLELFYPTDDNKDELISQRQLLSGSRDGFWAAGVHLYHKDREFGFTPLRQTIVLLMAAINNEL